MSTSRQAHALHIRHTQRRPAQLLIAASRVNPTVQARLSALVGLLVPMVDRLVVMPTLDPEGLKLVSNRRLRNAGARVVTRYKQQPKHIDRDAPTVMAVMPASWNTFVKFTLGLADSLAASVAQEQRAFLGRAPTQHDHEVWVVPSFAAPMTGHDRYAHYRDYLRSVGVHVLEPQANGHMEDDVALLNHLADAHERVAHGRARRSQAPSRPVLDPLTIASILEHPSARRHHPPSVTMAHLLGQRATKAAVEERDQA